MVTLTAALLAASLLLSTSAAAPQHVFSQSGRVDPLKRKWSRLPFAQEPDLSAISPFFIPTKEPTPLPPRCKLKRVSLLIRHSSILGNDEEYEETMGPFIRKIAGMDKAKFPQQGEWAFLRDWETPIVEANLEHLSERGRKDAKVSSGSRRLVLMISRPWVDTFATNTRAFSPRRRRG